jgi:hypothetical protein
MPRRPKRAWCVEITERRVIRTERWPARVTHAAHGGQRLSVRRVAPDISQGCRGRRGVLAPSKGGGPAPPTGEVTRGRAALQANRRRSLGSSP